MLQPVMTTPSAVSSAAPTLNVEYSACANSRALRAAAIRSESLNDPLEQRDEGAAHLPGGFQYFLVVERLRQDARRHVGDARHPQDLEPHVARRDCLRDGGHADGVCADAAQIADLRGRLVAGTGQRGVDTVPH